MHRLSKLLLDKINRALRRSWSTIFIVFQEPGHTLPDRAPTLWRKFRLWTFCRINYLILVATKLIKKNFNYCFGCRHFTMLSDSSLWPASRIGDPMPNRSMCAILIGVLLWDDQRMTLHRKILKFKVWTSHGPPSPAITRQRTDQKRSSIKCILPVDIRRTH